MKYEVVHYDIEDDDRINPIHDIFDSLDVAYKFIDDLPLGCTKTLPRAVPEL